MSLPAIVLAIIGHSYTVTQTYTQGPPPDCGQTPHGFHPCPAPRTTTIVRDIKVTAKDVVVVDFDHLDGKRRMHVQCAELAPIPGPPETPHFVDGPSVKPKGRAPALPLVIDTRTGRVVVTRATRCDELRNAP